MLHHTAWAGIDNSKFISSCNQVGSDDFWPALEGQRTLPRARAQLFDKRQSVFSSMLLLRRDRLSVCEQKQVFSAAGLRFRARIIDPAERVNTHQRPGRFTVKVQVAYVVFLLGPLDTLWVQRVERPCEPVLRVIGDMQGIVKILRLDHRQHWPENFLLGNTRMRVHVGEYRRLDKVARTMPSSACHP